MSRVLTDIYAVEEGGGGGRLRGGEGVKSSGTQVGRLERMSNSFVAKS